MTITHFEIVVGLLVSVLGVLAPIVTMFRWIYRQGAASAEHTAATRANTDALAEHRRAMEDFTGKAAGQLAEHERKLIRASDRLDALDGRGGL